MSLRCPRRRPVASGILAVFAAVVTLASPAIAETLVATKDVVLCNRLVDLDELEAHLKTEDKVKIDLYLTGAHPPCMVLKQGDTVELLDHSADRVQVVTRHGTPRFIAWGERSSFDSRP